MAAGFLGAQIVRYAHCDPHDLRARAEEPRSKYPKAIWSLPMGSSAWMAISPRLIKIYEVAQQFDAC